MNKLKKIFIGIVFLTYSTVVSAQATDTVNFFKGTLHEAFEQAGETGKLVFVDFYTEWCGPCKALEEFVFPTTEAAAYFNEKFICVKIDAEKGIGPELRKAYEVTAYPTFIILDSGAKTQARWTGGSMRPTPKQFIARVEQEIKNGTMKLENDHPRKL